MRPPTGERPHIDMSVDRKSTRLNSSHLVISYAVFCLKKKKNKDDVEAVLPVSQLHRRQLRRNGDIIVVDDDRVIRRVDGVVEDAVAGFVIREACQPLR